MRRLVWKGLLVACPFIWAIAPVLFLFAYNIGQISAIDLLLPMLIVGGVTLAFLLLVRLITKNHNKAVIIVSFVLFWFFAYGHILELWENLEGAIFDWRPTLVVLVFWGICTSIVVIGVYRIRRNFNTFVEYLTLTGLVFVVIALVNIGIFAVRANIVDFTLGVGEERSSFTESQVDLPDIYYIILDRYTSAEALDKYFGYDNSEFINYLSEKGFYIASKSRPNYSMTVTSLASSLNMEYINYLSDIYGEKSQDVNALLEIAANNKASQFLRVRGYSDVYIPTGVQALSIRLEYAKIFENKSRFGLSYFASSLLQGTPLRSMIDHYASLDYRGRILSGFDALAGIPEHFNNPVFVYAHILCPHPPYMFDRYGNIPEGEGTYIEQVMFVNKKVEAFVDEVLLKSRVPPIIILQADTGAGDVGGEASQYAILNAYLFPDRNYELLYESITPVNSLRVVFNLYFGANYELLEDKTYKSKYKQPFQFSPVEIDWDN